MPGAVFFACCRSSEACVASTRRSNVHSSALTIGMHRMDGVANRSGIGQPARRREDLRLLTGNGRYSDDLNLPGQAYAVMVRSPHAHARVRALDARRARQTPGALAVLTGHDFLADGLRPIPLLARGHPADLSL